jgi:hypothetical protein
MVFQTHLVSVDAVTARLRDVRRVEVPEGLRPVEVGEGLPGAVSDVHILDPAVDLAEPLDGREPLMGGLSHTPH